MRSSRSAVRASSLRFNLGLRDIKDLLAARGVTVSHETVRARVAQFVGQFATMIRRDRPRPNGKWNLRPSARSPPASSAGGTGS